MELKYGSDPNSPQTVVFPAAATFEKRSLLSKGRHRESPTTAYRINFHFDSTGSHDTSSKCKLTWRFGLSKRASWLDEGVEHREQVVEHEVVLILFMRSGKTDVVWNGVNMSHSFCEVSATGIFEYTWRSRTGESLQVIGYPGSSEGPQYDFLIDGIKFSDLPDMDDLRWCRLHASSCSEKRSDEGGSLLSCQGSEPYNNRESERSDPFEVVPYGSGFRLSLAGLNQGQEIEDELRSSLPSSALDALRDAIVSYMPDAEEIVSRAMLNALFDVAVSMTRPHVLNESYAANPFQIEAEMLKETLDWIDNHRFCSDLDDMKYVIMQKHVDAAFEHVHNDRLTVAEALRALLSVACLLKLNLSNPVVNNTVVIVDLATNTTTKDVIDALATFGEIENTAFVQETGFGVCRFRLDASVERVCAAAQEKRLLIAGTSPRILPVNMFKEVERGKASGRICESVSDCDACLGSPLRYLISDEDDYKLQADGLNFRGSIPSLRSAISASDGDTKLTMGNAAASKASTHGTMATVVSIDSIGSAPTAIDSCSLAL